VHVFIYVLFNGTDVLMDYVVSEVIDAYTSWYAGNQLEGMEQGEQKLCG
jgi:hypothetical protein